MLPLETNLDNSGAMSTTASSSLPQHQHHHHQQQQQQQQGSPSSFPTNNSMPLKTPKQPQHHTTTATTATTTRTTTPSLPYRPTSSTVSGSTPSSTSGHSRNSKGGGGGGGSSTGSGSSRSNNSNIVVSSFSNLATQSIAQGKYRQAYEYYQLALQDYLKDRRTVVELVNAAATCFNLGALAKKLHEYQQSAQYFCEAQDLYQQASDIVDRHVSRNRIGRKQGSEREGRQALPSTSSSSSSSNSCQVCLLQLLVETLQARAHLHYKYESLIDEAVECHEQVVELLEDNAEQHRRQQKQDTIYYKIQFTVLSTEGRRQLLVTSLQALGKFYVEKGELEDAIAAYQEALSLLRKTNGSSKSEEEEEGEGEEVNSTEQRQVEIVQILQALSDVFLQKNVHTTDVAQLERIALVQEDLENWDKALQCWERVLYNQSQKHGEESVEVATTLTQLARVMIMEGNLEGSLDLYHAAANIFLKNEAFLSDDIFTQITGLYKELDQISSAIAWLKSLVVRCPRREEQAQIQYQLGKLYLDQGLFHAASDSLCLSSDLCDGKDGKVLELMKDVESLRKRVGMSKRVETDHGRPGLAAITEDGESALAYEEDFSIDDALKSLNATMTEESNDDSPSDTVTIDSLVEKAKAMEGERLDALVNSTTHPLLTNESKVDRSLEQSTVNTVSDDSAFVEGYDDSPQKETKDSLHTIDDVREEDQNIEDEESDEDYDAGSEHRAQDIKEDENPNSQHSSDVASKSTQETEPSVSSSPGGAAMTKSIQLYSEPADMPNYVSADSSAEGSVSGDQDRAGYEGEFEASEEASEDKEDVYESFQRDNDSASGTREIISKAEESPSLSHQEHDYSDNTPSPMFSTTSRTGLLMPTEKLELPHKSLNMPNLSSPRNPKNKDRRGYTEVSEKQSGRRRIVKALANPFRRSRSKSRSRSGGGFELDPLDEEKEVRAPMPSPKTLLTVPDEESIHTNMDAPVSYVDMRNIINDDDEESQVSQITFRMEEPIARKNEKDGQWWWGVTAEGLEGWFPSSYVHQAVEAAEGFLSAKAIHDRVKSRPLDFDSDEESEVGFEEDDISVLRDASSKQSKNNSAGASKSTLSKPSALTSQKRKVSNESSGAKPSGSSGSANAVMASKSESSKNLSTDALIEEKLIRLNNLKTLHGEEDPSVADVMFELALLYNKKKDADVAVNYCRQALDIQKATMNLSDACKSLLFIADVQSRGKRYHEALSCYSEAQRLQEATYGYFHEETANTFNRIGNVLARQGEFDLAMKNHKEALRILKECCGENVKHPLVSQTLIQIGAVYYKERNSLATIQSKIDGYSTFIEGGMLEVIGRAHEERGSYRMAIAFFEEKLQFLNDDENSDDLEDIAETLNSLGMLSCRAGLYLEAIDYYDRALGIQVKLGCDDVQLAMARVLAGSVQFSLGHFNKALKLFQDALDTLRQNVGLEQETVAATLFHMGVVRAALCNYDEAMSNLQDALSIQTKLLGLEHPATLRTRREIGNLFSIYEAELDAAFAEYNDVLEVQKRIHGEKHPNVAETLHSIGCAQAKKGDFQSALRTLEDCYNMRLEFLGYDHPSQATTLHEIAKIQLKRNRLKKALHIIDAALNIRVESLSEQHIDVALAMVTKGSCLVARGSFAEANKLFLEALPVATSAVGEIHPSVASIHVQIGIMHLRKCHFDEASEAIHKALDIYRNSELDEDHPGIKEAAEELERVERAEMLCV
jgi:tetratricopeptide (TPR) repeat protein